MKIHINGVYEYDTGRRDYVHLGQEVYRIYVYKKIRNFYRCLINQTGTDRIIHENVKGKWLRESCKYLGQAHITWENLFQEVGEDGVQ